MKEASEKYLLYIDILGFSNLVKKNSEKIQELFKIIDSLNVHRHDAFKTIVFSDTILVCNKPNLLSQHDHESCIMYACEFVYDLLLRSIRLGIQFRAILTYGEFQYKEMKNIEVFHGKSLIAAYNKEKEINAIGLFIDKKIAANNRFYATVDFDTELEFVFLTSAFETICKELQLSFPTNKILVNTTDLFHHFSNEVKYLQTLKDNIDTQIDSKIRDKYLHTYHFYKTRYPKHISELEAANFDFKILSPDANWKLIEENQY